ncbi:MAG: hypothetical protein AAB447_01585 [Patescibacteria group bacterium]
MTLSTYEKLSHSAFAVLLQLSIQGLVTFGTPASLRMLETMLLKINSRNSNPKLIDLIIRSAALYNEALVVEEVLGFTARKVVSNCPKCNQIFSMDGTRSGHSDHQRHYQYTVCPMCYHQFDSSCWPIHPLRNVPAELANVLVGQE